MFSQEPTEHYFPSVLNPPASPPPMHESRASTIFVEKAREAGEIMVHADVMRSAAGLKYDGENIVGSAELEIEDQEDEFVKYGRFSFRTGVPESRSDTSKSIIFIPEVTQNKNARYPDIAKEIWGMGEANMILKLCAGSRHPKVLVNSLLAETPGYQHLKKEASLQVKRKSY